MFLMLRGVIRIDQDIVKVDDNIDVEQVALGAEGVLPRG